MGSPRTSALVAAGLAAALAATAAPAPARARPASTGWFTEGGLGATGFLADAQSAAAIGPSLSLRLGRDLASWLSLGIHLGASSHEATVPPPPVGEWVQLYRGAGDARLGFRAGRIAVFAEGGVGGAYMSSNVLAKVGILDPGERLSLAFNAGGGVEYQILNRHYAFGLAGDWWLMPQFDALAAVEVRLYLRYTY